MSSLTLYEAADQLAVALDQVDPETGELDPAFGAMHELVQAKGVAVAAFIAQRELEAEGVAARVKEVNRQLAAQEKRIAWLRRYLLDNMARTGITEIKSNDSLLKIKRYIERDKAVEIFDATQIPVCYMTVPKMPDPVPDKRAISHAIESGHDVAGAKIVKRDRLVIG